MQHLPPGPKHVPRSSFQAPKQDPEAVRRLYQTCGNDTAVATGDQAMPAELIVPRVQRALGAKPRASSAAAAPPPPPPPLPSPSPSQAQTVDVLDLGGLSVGGGDGGGGGESEDEFEAAVEGEEAAAALELGGGDEDGGASSEDEGCALGEFTPRAACAFAVGERVFVLQPTASSEARGDEAAPPMRSRDEGGDFADASDVAAVGGDDGDDGDNDDDDDDDDDGGGGGEEQEAAERLALAEVAASPFKGGAELVAVFGEGPIGLEFSSFGDFPDLSRPTDAPGGACVAVMHVAAGGAADHAGVAACDLIVRLNGQPLAEGLTKDGFFELLAATPRPLALTFQRRSEAPPREANGEADGAAGAAVDAAGVLRRRRVWRRAVVVRVHGGGSALAVRYLTGQGATERRVPLARIKPLAAADAAALRDSDAPLVAFAGASVAEPRLVSAGGDAAELAGGDAAALARGLTVETGNGGKGGDGASPGAPVDPSVPEWLQRSDVAPGSGDGLGGSAAARGIKWGQDFEVVFSGQRMGFRMQKDPGSGTATVAQVVPHEAAASGGVAVGDKVREGRQSSAHGILVRDMV